LSRKAVHNWVQNFLSRTLESRKWCPTRCGSGWDNSQKTTVLRKVMVQVYPCSWRICREINTFSCFTFYIHLWRNYWFSLVQRPI
jgi:hypothetical protein